jgi:hydrogenase nickel incorporation protein HypB
MCDTCGCNVTPGNEHLVAAGGHLAKTSGGNESVEVLKGLLDANDHQAAHNREHFARHNALAVNLMSSPGAGKTALLEATADAFGDEFKFAVIEGDLETENDAERIRQKGVPAVQISTGSACHNVGNLVCPASFDLGQHLNVILLSTPEGHDKPAKYPVMFRAADLVLVTKADLLPVLDDFDPAYAEDCLRNLANTAPFMWLRAQLVALRSRDAVVGAD